MVSVTIDSGPGEDKLRFSVNGVEGAQSGDTGADTMIADKDSKDLISGDQGNDTINSGAGDDEVRGEEGNDTLTSGDGNDKVFGGSGADVLDTGAGDDTINVSDGVADKVNCGAGNDTVVADTLDELTDCENVGDRQFVAPPSDDGSANDTTKPTLRAG